MAKKPEAGGDKDKKPEAAAGGDKDKKPAAASEAKPAAAKPAAGKPSGGKPGAKGAAAPAKKVKKKAAPKKLYAVAGGKISRTKTECPRCGTGFFMAVHYNRKTCGACSFTQFTDKDGNIRGIGAPQGGGPGGVMRHSRRIGREQPRGGAGGPGDDEEK